MTLSALRRPPVLATIAAMAVLLGTTAVWSQLHHPPAAAGPRPPRVEVLGAHAIDSREIRAIVADSVHETRPDDDAALERARQYVLAYYYDRGYARIDALVEYDPAQHRVVTSVSEGALYRISAVVVTGELVGDDAANRADLQLRAGDLLCRATAMADIGRLQLRYRDLGYPNAVVATTTEVDDVQRTMSITYHVKRQ